MNIKIALIDNDKNYIERFINAFGEFYPQIEIYSFSNIDKAISSLQSKPVDVVLISDGIYDMSKDRLKELSTRSVIVMVESKGISMIDDCMAVCKYQRVDHLDQVIMKIYSEQSGMIINDNSSAGVSRTVTFISGSGGNGCSTAAAAYAVYLASQKLKVLYLDLHVFGMPELLFEDDGNYTMTDCIGAVIDEKSNLSTQLKSFVRHDPSGVYFYHSCIKALDWSDATADNIQTMIKSIVESGDYNYVIIDAENDWNDTNSFLAEFSNTLFVVSDGSTFSNKKAAVVWDAVTTYLRLKHNDNVSNMYMLYTCFTENGKKIKSDAVREYVTLPYSYGHHSAGELVRNLSARQYWEMQARNG